MQLVRRLAAVLDTVERAVTLVRLTPSRRARAAEEGWTVAFMRRVDWTLGGGSFTARLEAPAECGCRMVGDEIVAFDIDCPVHDPLGSAD